MGWVEWKAWIKATGFIIAMVIMFLLMVLGLNSSIDHAYVAPIESTRNVILTCIVKSNIEGVITLNDDCKITVIGEE